MTGAGPFSDADARAAWERGAAAWLDFVRGDGDYYRHLVHGPALLAAADVRTGERALDLGCGEGWFSRALARAGARVSALDLAPTLIAHARTEERRAPLGIDYRVGSAAAAQDAFAGDRFDLVTSCMAIQDMSDPGAAFRAATDLLARGGRIVVSLPHPANDMPVRTWQRDAAGHKVAIHLDRYFDTGPTVMRWNMPRLSEHWETPYWRRTLEQWTELTLSAGLVIRRMREPRPDAAAVARNPELDDCARLPYFLILDLIRAPA